LNFLIKAGMIKNQCRAKWYYNNIMPEQNWSEHKTRKEYIDKLLINSKWYVIWGHNQFFINMYLCPRIILI
jgi:hypothetical protein